MDIYIYVCSDDYHDEVESMIHVSQIKNIHIRLIASKAVLLHIKSINKIAEYLIFVLIYSSTRCLEIN